MPLFRRERYFQRYEHGDIDRSLIRTLVALSTKLQGLKDLWSDSDPDDYLRTCLDSQGGDEETPITFVSLDKFRIECLLAFYEFHQCPGHKAWLRIGRLTRRAYQCGLHQLDNQDQCQLYDLTTIDEDEVEDWRHLWWCIYCLDSYCNITAATPFLVESDSVRTALISTSSPLGSDSAVNPQIFLPPDTDNLWETVKQVLSLDQNVSFNLQILTQTALRKAATLARLWRQNPSDRLQSRFAAMENHVSSIRLALPMRYFYLARNVVANESGPEHHARLVTLLQFHACRLTLGLRTNVQQDETEWLNRWQDSLEYCEDIASVVREWDPQFCSSVDPAICFIVVSILIIVHLHTKVQSNSDPELQSRLSGYRDLLLLFMEQFASIWRLPRFLISKYSKIPS